MAALRVETPTCTHGCLPRTGLNLNPSRQVSRIVLSSPAKDGLGETSQRLTVSRIGIACPVRLWGVKSVSQRAGARSRSERSISCASLRAASSVHRLQDLAWASARQSCAPAFPTALPQYLGGHQVGTESGEVRRPRSGGCALSVPLVPCIRIPCSNRRASPPTVLKALDMYGERRN